MNGWLNSGEFRDDLRGFILGLGLSGPPQSVEILNVFLSNLVMQLGYSVLIYYVQTIHGFSATQKIRRKRSQDKLDSKEFLQLSYYIGGSIVSGYLFKGQKYKDSKWKKFVTILKTKFSRVQAVGNACADDVRNFTEEKEKA